jgi:hypothetical protein
MAITSKIIVLEMAQLTIIPDRNFISKRDCEIL